ncbi:hypothetical protein ACFL9T_15865 [Thermodesulfobacteriota bacterium]
MKLTTRHTLLLVLVFLVGCVLTPKTYQLEKIHQNYTTEWADWSATSLPAASTNPKIVDGRGRFKNTLAGIKNYRQEHGDTSSMVAHLTVLEGMIYIQSGTPGMAKLLVPEVKEAVPRLKSATGVVTRDYLFAMCYEHLTNGWAAIYKKGVNVQPVDFSEPADKIKEILNKIPKEKRAEGYVDSGGAYVATSAAIFYLWAHAAAPTKSELPDMATKGKAVLKPWLSNHEICAVEKGTYKNQAFEWGGRLRYLEWYDFLHTKSGSVPPEPCP